LKETNAQEPMVGIARAMLRKLSPNLRITLFDNLADFKGLNDDRLTMGTGCSGTDVMFHAADVVCCCLKKEMGWVITPVHQFSAESSPFKREFIKTHWSPEVLLNDIALLKDEVGFDVLTGLQKAIPKALIAAVGFECDSVSGLNRHASLNRSCIAEKRDKTGSHPSCEHQCSVNVQTDRSGGRPRLWPSEGETVSRFR
jgi:hypothetical protein